MNVTHATPLHRGARSPIVGVSMYCSNRGFAKIDASYSGDFGLSPNGQSVILAHEGFLKAMLRSEVSAVSAVEALFLSHQASGSSLTCSQRYESYSVSPN